MGRRVLVLAVAIILAGLAALAVWQVLTNAEEAAKEGLEEVVVYRAVVLIPEGTEGLNANANEWIIESVELEQYRPDNAITNEEDLLTFVTDGKVAAGPISAGSILTSDQWTTITADVRSLADVIPNGTQAMTISAPGAQGLNQMVEPGDRINMIVSGSVELIGFEPVENGLSELTPEEAAGDGTSDTTGVDLDGDGVVDTQLERTTKSISRYVLQGLTVLAVGTELIPEPDAETVVTVPPAPGEEAAAAPEDGTRTLLTLEVTPDEAERIAFATGFGQIWLTLNPTNNVQAAETEGVVIENLFADFGILTTLFPELADLENFLGGGQ